MKLEYPSEHIHAGDVIHINEKGILHEKHPISMDQETVMKVTDPLQKLTVKQLAEAMYEGTRHVQNLAEKLARQHGKAQALTFFGMMGEDVQNFWMGIAQQLIDHASHWQKNQGSSCVLDKEESRRLHELPRHPASQLSPMEALFGFMAWLSTREEAIIISSKNSPTDFLPLLQKFADTQKLALPRDTWADYMVPMGNAQEGGVTDGKE